MMLGLYYFVIIHEKTFLPLYCHKDHISFNNVVTYFVACAIDG